ncbi:MAG: hypothetical protein FWF88_09915 [Peptococcaceae bacterium]|nr:hypothetical protein [Peptococcaceae bacterium]
MDGVVETVTDQTQAGAMDNGQWTMDNEEPLLLIVPRICVFHCVSEHETARHDGTIIGDVPNIDRLISQLSIVHCPLSIN